MRAELNSRLVNALDSLKFPRLGDALRTDTLDLAAALATDSETCAESVALCRSDHPASFPSFLLTIRANLHFRLHRSCYMPFALVSRASPLEW